MGQEFYVTGLELKRLVSKYRLTLVAGSYHDPNRFHNLTAIIAHSDREPIVVTHAKQNTKIRAFEHVRSPPTQNLRYYQTAEAVFAVLVGIDIFDPSLTLRLSYKNHLYSTEEKVDVIFVPCFTQKDASEFTLACKDLSYMTASLVVFVNGKNDAPRHAAYLGGEEVENKSKAIDCKVTLVSENVKVYEIAFDEYQRIRSLVSDQYSPLTDYMIGHKDGVRLDLKLRNVSE